MFFTSACRVGREVWKTQILHVLLHPHVGGGRGQWNFRFDFYVFETRITCNIAIGVGGVIGASDVFVESDKVAMTKIPDGFWSYDLKNHFDVHIPRFSSPHSHQFSKIYMCVCTFCYSPYPHILQLIVGKYQLSGQKWVFFNDFRPCLSLPHTPLPNGEEWWEIKPCIHCDNTIPRRHTPLPSRIDT